MARHSTPRPHPVLSVLTVVGVVLFVIWLAQRSLIYFPDGDLPSPAAVGLPDAEVVMFETEDGLHLEAWFVPARPPVADRTIVVFNGNAGHRGYRARLAALFAEYGFATLLVDYRGYGGNPGLPSEAGLERDARAAIGYLATRPDVDLTRVVYFGESLGAAVAIRLAQQYPPSALVLRSPFSSLVAIGQWHYPFMPVSWLARDRYPSIERIGSIACPILVIAGDADRIVPIEDTRELFDAAPEPRQLVVIAGADHNDESLSFGAELVRSVVEFLER
ncbi:MAG TPA: alpha/beta hydrolase [Vicinamibacterales bacterium]|nr:alpha/beta hydrolase [Vicinamibacterales bacterium]